ncbi:hypothetical protein DFH06DRAFT_255238 [Mycena polygramma]|nr:hypothetical protein DFH06DRAFT_255238 [Mycena polygramma]
MLCATSMLLCSCLNLLRCIRTRAPRFCFKCFLLSNPQAVPFKSPPQDSSSASLAASLTLLPLASPQASPQASLQSFLRSARLQCSFCIHLNPLLSQISLSANAAQFNHPGINLARRFFSRMLLDRVQLI